MASQAFDVTAALQIISEARKEVPAVKYALAAAGIAAAAGLSVLFLGDGRVALIIFGAMVIAMFVVFLFARLITLHSGSIRIASLVMLWAITIFFCAFLALTLSAYTIGVPKVYAGMLGVDKPTTQPQSGFWIIAKSSPASNPVSEQGVIAIALDALQRCGQRAIQDASEKFSGFTGGRIVVVAGPFAARDIDEALKQVRICVPDAYRKWAEYTG